MSTCKGAGCEHSSHIDAEKVEAERIAEAKRRKEAMQKYLPKAKRPLEMGRKLAKLNKRIDERKRVKRVTAMNKRNMSGQMPLIKNGAYLEKNPDNRKFESVKSIKLVDVVVDEVVTGYKMLVCECGNANPRRFVNRMMGDRRILECDFCHIHVEGDELEALIEASKPTKKNPEVVKA